MPVVRDSGARQSGVYQWLRGREETRYEDWQASVHSQAVGAVYLRRAALEALRAGRPMSVLVVQLPNWARPAGFPPTPKTRADMTEEYWRRSGEGVTVHADDRIAPYDDRAVPLADEYMNL